MKRDAKIVGYSVGALRVLACPFCGLEATENPAMPWCVGCQVEYYATRRGSKVIFDDARKTERFAWAKALNAAGGVRLGKEPK